MSEPSPHHPARWLNSTVLGFGIASFFSDIGLECTAVLLPVLIASMGAGSLVMGIIEGSADGLSCFARLMAGHLSDHLPRRKLFAAATYMLVAGGMACLALASLWWHVLILRLITSVGRGTRTPVRNVLLAEASRPEHYGRVFGFERTMDSAGAVVGPLLALLLVRLLDVRSVFVASLLPGIIAMLFVLVLVQEQKQGSYPQAQKQENSRSLPRPFRKFLTGAGIAGLGDFSNLLLILWATEAWTPVYGTPAALQMAMLCYVGYNAVFALSCSISGRLADQFPRQVVLAGGYCLAIIPAIALLIPGASVLKFVVAFGCSGVYMGVVETLETAMAATILPQAVRGKGFGVLSAVNGVGDFLSSVMVGFMWWLHPALAMSFVITTTLVGAAITVSIFTRREG